MAERTTRTLAAVALAAALAGCAATHVGDDWQCPLAQGEVCTSIAAADPAVAPDAAPPPLATRTPLFRAPESEAEVEPEAETETTTKPGTATRSCAEGCNPFVWLGRMLAPRADAAERVESDEAVSAAPPVETSAPVATGQADATPCVAGQPAPKPAEAAVHADDGAAGTDDGGAPCATATEAQATATPAPIAPSTTAAIPCGMDDAPATRPVEAEPANDAHVSEDAETPCAAPASVEETVASESPEAAEAEVTAAVDTPLPAVDAPPSPATTLLPPPPAPDALRTGEVVGRIWIAPFVDAGGVYREGAWVRAVLAPAGWRR